MRSKVSVVIPVYNVEKYLSRCIDSVVKQTLKDIEIILVNDGSKDNSGNICDMYSSKYKNIKVIHKKNGGLASARNAGMVVASGKYLFFVDSDDWIDENTLEELVGCAQKYNVDFVRYRPMYSGWPNIVDGTLCDFGTENGMREGLYNKIQIKEEIYPRLIVSSELTLGPIVAVWRSLYNLDFLRKNNIVFDEKIKYSEDTYFSAKIVLACNSFYYVDGAKYYHYFFNPSSITKSFKEDRWECYKELFKSFEADFSSNIEYDFTKQLQLQKVYFILSALSQRNLINDKHKKREYCKKICYDPITVEVMKNLDGINVSKGMRILLEIIRRKFVFLLMRI